MLPQIGLRLFGRSCTIKNIIEFKHDILIYIDCFEEMLRLLGGTPKGEKYMSTTLFKKGGVTGNPGLPSISSRACLNQRLAGIYGNMLMQARRLEARIGLTSSNSSLRQ